MLNLPSSENSYWRDSAPKTSYDPLSHDLEVDVAIVGGGISGLTAGYLLKNAGKKVAVLEKDCIAGGTTGFTTGKVTSQHNLIYADIAKHSGEQTARIYGQANQTAIAEIEKVIKGEKINCDWHREDNYVFTCDPDQVEKFKQEAEVARSLGLPANFQVTTPLPFSIEGAVRFTNQAYFHSAKYAGGLAAAIHGHGSYIFEDSNVIGIHDGKHVKTKEATVFAKDIIVATNVPTFPLMARGGYCILEYPETSYIVAARLTKKLPGMYISPDEGEYSILPVTAGRDRLLLIGGQAHIPGAKFNKKTRYKRLADYAEERFGVNGIEYKWHARDYQAYDNVPLVGKMYPWSKHLYVVTAFRKWGLTNSMVAGIILRDAILGESNDWAAVYDPTRLKPVLSIPRVAAKYIFKQ